MRITLSEVHTILVPDIMGTNIKQEKNVQGKIYAARHWKLWSDIAQNPREFQYVEFVKVKYTE